jgi:hypothetical protein
LLSLATAQIGGFEVSDGATAVGARPDDRLGRNLARRVAARRALSGTNRDC